MRHVHTGLITSMLSFFQSWGDFPDVSQALIVYCGLMYNLFVFCWLGNQLTDQVKNTYFHISMSTNIHILHVCSLYKTT